jgi:broad specificity phosphatase PhoE
MARIRIVRHGHAAAGFGEDMDPGLDDLGRTQAEAAGEQLRGIDRALILSSPLKRAQETAAPLARHWNRTPAIVHAVAEIPSPKGMSLEERAVWLRKLMAGPWRDVTPELAQWRAACIAAVAGLKEDVVIFSHYVAINVLMGAAVSDDRVVVFSPANCSVTVFDNSGGKLTLLDKGEEASLTRVN